MLIDWITARVPTLLLNPAALDACRNFGDRVQRFCPKSGNVLWETSAWDSIRSDSHQLAMRSGLDFWVQGSPARVIGEGDAVFGAGASAALDILGCVQRMIDMAASHLGVTFPPAECWIVSRVDVTGNMCLSSLPEVRDSLRILRECEGGRYRVSQQAGDTVYWSHLSKLRSGKAYAKGPHLRYLVKRSDYSGYPYTETEINNADKLLRLELKLGREHWNRNDWKTTTPEQLKQQWDDYFGRMIGNAEMTNDDELKTRIIEIAPTEGRGKAAYGFWVLIQSQGWERAREMVSRNTYYSHLRILRSAGLGDADISSGNIVQLRRRILDAQLVNNWKELNAA